MSQMLPEGGEVMRRVACADVCPAPASAPALAPLPTPATHRSDNKELLRQQLLSACERPSPSPAAAAPPPRPRVRQRNRWKLKFHHQALPPEYLDHYEQSQRAQRRAKPKPVQHRTDATPVQHRTDTIPGPHRVETTPGQNRVETTPGQNRVETTPGQNRVETTPEPEHANESFSDWAQRLAAGTRDAPQKVASGMALKPPKGEKRRNPAIQPSKILTYDDLPYMGEMTLNNAKPRRGRKPKKADICHLIYENYGTVVPGQPPPALDPKLSQLTMCPPFRVTEDTPTPKTDLQNRIISSLLERKLSQENKKKLECSPPSFCSPDAPMPEAPITIAGPLHSDDEPLNLCIRDLHELKLQIQKKFGNIYTSFPEVKSEPEDLESPKSEQSNAISVIQRNTNLPTAASSPDLSRLNRDISPALSEPAQSTVTSDGEVRVPGVYWPNAGLYMHPLALQTQLLYYQRLAAAGQMPFTLEHKDVSSRNTETSTEALNVDDSKKKLVLKQISELLDPKVIKHGSKSPDQVATKRVSPNPAQGAVKRKRSAIFIPPVPSKSTTTPTTEVSICKFKFTGGSKPSLQEKKMLSVDSGGNFRYYSGTGNKGNKGYDYLHRDSNQGKAAALQAAAAKATTEPPALLKEDPKKKRKSRKSLQREKLEQTFKEKGFLIQTQQLQSAEGATYCKFRQLRKFTRYLFRSWKDYLPGGGLEGQGTPAPLPAPRPSGSGGPPNAGEWG